MVSVYLSVYSPSKTQKYVQIADWKCADDHTNSVDNVKCATCEKPKLDNSRNLFMVLENKAIVSPDALFFVC